MGKTVRAVVTREVALLLILITLAMTAGTVFVQWQWERQNARIMLNDFESTLMRDQDNLLLHVLLEKAHDINVYFESLKAKYPQVEFCVDLNPPFAGLQLLCPPGHLQDARTFALLGNRNHLLRFSSQLKSGVAILLDLLRTPLFFSTILGSLLIALYLRLRLRRLLTRPLTQMKGSIRDLVNGSRSLSLSKLQHIQEWQEIDSSLRDLAAYLVQLEKVENEAGQAKIARQVAHDIRSPLSLLRIAAQVLTEVPPERRALLASATERIEEIVASLNPTQMQKRPLTGTDVEPLIASIVREKQLLTNNSPEITLAFDKNPTEFSCVARVEPAQFKRVMSNLLNNSIEALGEQRGSILVRVVAEASSVEVSLLDSGRGISEWALPQVSAGQSVGKPTGQGLGLSHARAAVESWGGKLTLASAEHLGTVLTISLLPLRNSGESNLIRADGVSDSLN